MQIILASAKIMKDKVKSLLSTQQKRLQKS